MGQLDCLIIEQVLGMLWVFAFEKNKHPQLYKHTQTHFNTHNPQYNIREIQTTTNVLFPTQCNNFSSRTPTGITVCIPWFSWAIRWTACFSLLPMCRPGFRDHELNQAVQEPRGTKPDIERKCWYHHANSHKSSTYNSYGNSWEKSWSKFVLILRTVYNLYWNNLEILMTVRTEYAEILQGWTIIFLVGWLGNIFLTLTLFFLVDNSVCKDFFNIQKHRALARFFFRWLLLHDCFSAVFAVQDFWGQLPKPNPWSIPNMTGFLGISSSAQWHDGASVFWQSASRTGNLSINSYS